MKKMDPIRERRQRQTESFPRIKSISSNVNVTRARRHRETRPIHPIGVEHDGPIGNKWKKMLDQRFQCFARPACVGGKSIPAIDTKSNQSAS